MKQKTLIALVAALCLLSSVGPIQVFAESGSGSSHNGSDDSLYDDNDNEDDSDDTDDSDEDDNDSDDDSESEDESEDGDDDSDDENRGPQKRPWFSPLRSGILEEKRDERREAIKTKLFEDESHDRSDKPLVNATLHAEIIASKIAMFHARLGNILIRIQSNIDAQAKDGKDVTKAQSELDAAKSDLRNAQNLMAKIAQARADAQLQIKTEVQASAGIEPVKDIVKPIHEELRPEIREDMEAVRDLMKSAHVHMMASVKALKSL